MKGISGHVGKVLFRLKWLLWTPEQNYLYLWNRTCGK
jgi:hypothetical protein